MSETLFKTIIAVLGVIFYVIKMGEVFGTGLNIVTLQSKRRDKVIENRSIYSKYSRILIVVSSFMVGSLSYRFAIGDILRGFSLEIQVILAILEWYIFYRIVYFIICMIAVKLAKYDSNEERN